MSDMRDPDAVRHASSRRPAVLLVLVTLTTVAGCDAFGGTTGHASTVPASRAGSIAVPSSAALSPSSSAALWPTPVSSQAGASIPATSPSVTPSQAAPAPSAAASPSPSPGPFAMDLYHPGAFVTETSKVMCVAAAMQVMTNIMTGADDLTLATERRLYTLARRLSPPTLKGDGAEPEGWARALEELGYGRFAVRALPTMKAAIQAAAAAVRLTGRPAGLLVWYGAHSWVMSGFRSTADPALTDRFVVTAVSIEDVWYPKISTIWGKSRPPDSLVPVTRLPRDFLPWRMPGGPYPDKAWKYVIVVPVP